MPRELHVIPAAQALCCAVHSRANVWRLCSGSDIMQTDLSVLDDLVEEYMLQEELTDKARLVRSLLYLMRHPSLL